MPLTKAQKQTVLDDLKEKIAKQKAMVFVDFAGIKVKDLSVLRKRLKTAGDNITIAKKTLLRMALKKAGIEIDVKNLKGEIATIFGLKDGISPAKLIYQFSLGNPNLKILGGFLENKFFEAEKIIELAQLPTKEGLLARLVGSMASPISGLVNVLHGNLRNLVYILSKIKVTQ